MSSRNGRRIWAGRGAFGLIVAGLAAYLAAVGIEEADKRASSIAAVLALAALGAPYLFARPAGAAERRVEGSGDATATRGGEAGSSIRIAGDSAGVHIARSGNARAEGRGSIASSSVRFEAQR
ncbi:hypothetical protein AB0M02_25175 [Actinoplanes sp. NPDC051861]|uniref:hypothetical protein n=1 Tax=Actinoplanes sp. NPDC051861 TaxID=3155170 RepID=UPI003438F4FA